MCKDIELQSFVWTSCGPRGTRVFADPMDILGPMGTWLTTDWPSTNGDPYLVVSCSHPTCMVLLRIPSSHGSKLKSHAAGQLATVGLCMDNLNILRNPTYKWETLPKSLLDTTHLTCVTLGPF